MDDIRQPKTFPGGDGPLFEVTDLPEPPVHLTPRKLLGSSGRLLLPSAVPLAAVNGL